MQLLFNNQFLLMYPMEGDATQDLSGKLYINTFTTQLHYNE